MGVRGRLAANGLRVGIVSGQLPAHLADRLTGTLAADDATGSQKHQYHISASSKMDRP